MMEEKNFLNVENDTEQYLSIIKEINVKEPGKKFKNALKILSTLKTYKIEDNSFESEFSPLELSSALSLYDFIEDIILINKHEDFHKLRNLITMLHSSDFIQNWSTTHLSGKNLNKNNQLWELFFALQIYKMGDKIELESDNPTTKNPDIIGTIDHLRWGFACKVLNPKLGQINVITFIVRLKEGISQLENSDIEKGLVVFNGRNYIKHFELLKSRRINNKYLYFIYSDDKTSLNAFNEQINIINLEFKKKIETISNEIKETKPLFWRNLLGIENKTYLQWLFFYFSTSICHFQGKLAIEKLVNTVIQGEELEHSIFVDLIKQINDAYYNKNKKKTYNGVSLIE